MKKIYFLFLLISPFILIAQTNVGITGTVDGVYINEFHYDNIGTDVGEFVEVAGPAGTDLSNYTVTLYNQTGSAYETIPLTGLTIDDEGSGVGSIQVPYSGSIQNGGNDGLALSSSATTDVQFLSYEGTTTATAGAANGLTSVDIGVEESFPYPGESLEYDETTMGWGISYTATLGVYAQGNILSTKENQIDGFELYPNPTSEAFITISSDNRAPIKVSVFDILGKQVVQRTITDNRLNVSNFNTGVYILRAEQDNAFTTRKLIIN